MCLRLSRGLLIPKELERSHVPSWSTRLDYPSAVQADIDETCVYARAGSLRCTLRVQDQLGRVQLGLSSAWRSKIHQSGWRFNQIICIARGGLRVADVLSRIFEPLLAILSTHSY